ncbi:PLP-dependent aspartate aminotransferase family protein [Aequorivita sp. SDUM287046]|uniref:PLP-dependent aspartate aminotransferase family protein n=1 Tax=Aequorivita aurantiaca TaxID=3053356 RepID=A0ABT8DM72_9FLAO|nr:PLP-dependent aspartate aminotransferase family protein [Aequorivita aurantiaca]MDN3725076.1 PLP-dependent aspartate aminotransferase family protein [Aequorivita aurantiaca]
MKSRKLGINTICTHVGEIEDKQFKGAISPLYMSTSYAYENVEVKRYPRYFNTPNQEALCKKIAMLEKCEAALIFGSGMAAISTAMLAFLHKGDHVVLQQTLYGGTYNFVVEEFHKYGIEYSFAEGFSEADFSEKIQENTKVIFVETPSNPLMRITDLEMVSRLAKSRGIITMIDNTFASPVNQTPADFGIDIMIHSATKYMGGHSDILAGAVAASNEHIDKIWNLAKNLGGSLSDFTVWLLERSMKTMVLRVKAQSKNAKKIAKWLDKHPFVAKVYYPGLKTHPDYALAKKQMHGSTGMLSFEINQSLDVDEFLKSLNLIKPSMSLAGVESTILSPAKTSHALLPAEERKRQNINDGLLRFSVGIEETEDLIADMKGAFQKISKKDLV